MSAERAILLTLVGYQLILLGIGWACRARTRDGTDFFLGGRKLGPLVSAVGASASSSSAWTLLGVSGAAYAWGVSALWLVPACVGGFLLNWLVLAPALQRLSHASRPLTMIEVLAGPPGAEGRRAIATLAGLIVLASLTVYVGSQFQGVGKTFGSIFGIAAWQSVLIGAGVILVYTWLGGLAAVGFTDTLQGLVMAATSIVLPVAALIEVGGFGALAEHVATVPAEGYGSWGGARTPMLAVGFVAGLLGIGLGYPGQPHVVKYFMALHDEPGAVRRARWIAVSWAAVVYPGMVLLGLCGRALMPELADREVVFIEAVRLLFSPVVGGVMLAAVLSAIMSTADSQLLVASSTAVHDLSRSPEVSLRRSRAAVVVITGAAAVLALTGTEEIFSRVLVAWSALGAAFGPLLLITVVMGRRVSRRRSFAAMATGFVLAAAAHNIAAIPGDVSGVAERVVPFVVAFAIAFAGSRRPEGAAAGPA